MSIRPIKRLMHAGAFEGWLGLDQSLNGSDGHMVPLGSFQGAAVATVRPKCEQARQNCSHGQSRAHLDTTRPDQESSLSSRKEGEGRGEEANLVKCPDPLPTRSSRGEGEYFS